ncbi:Coupling protein TraD [Klebsiella pneumoniae]|nr:Coupling protein TraD [Klebsiella pneumoniae]
MSFNAKDMTQGGQIANMRFRMFGQIANIIFYVLFILFWVLCGLMLMYRLSWQTFVNGCVYWWCTTLGPRYYSFPAGIHHSVLRPVAGIYLRTNSPINILLVRRAAVDWFRLCCRGFSCYLYRDVLHRQLGAGPPETAVRMRTPAGASFPISPKSGPPDEA